MQAVSTSPYHLSMARKFNTWYTVKDGNWSDPTIWVGNAKRKFSVPQAGDNVCINNSVTVDANNYIVNDLYATGDLIFSATITSSLTVSGDLQVIGTLDMSTTHICNLTLNGVNNFVGNFITPGSNSTINYNGLGDQTIMYLPYANLGLAGTGNKNVVNGLTISGTTSISGNAIMLNQSLTGVLTFVGQFSMGGSGTTPLPSLNNVVNANIIFEGGLSWDVRFANLNIGTGNVYFNGTQTIGIGGGSAYNNYNTIIIEGSSVVTIPSGNTPFVVNGGINGTTSSSTLNVSGILWQATNVEPMTTGIYNYNYGGTSTIGYVYNGNYTLPYTSYHNLQINGTGIKTSGGATTLTGNLTLDYSGILELSSYDFTVDGTATFNDSSGITKNSGTGYTTFKGQLNMETAASAVFAVNYPCTVEFQNGLYFDVNVGAPVFVSGVTLRFTTNNQAIDSGHGASAMWGCDILISGAITVTNQNWGFGITGTLNGDNASSTFNNIVSLTYENVQQPMQTGILSSNNSGTKNAFIYGLAGNQDITPGNYYNLTLNGSGAKRLLGNVTVYGTYALTSPATLNSNGYTLTP